MSWQPGEPLPDDMFIWPNWAVDHVLERVEIMRHDGVVDCEKKAEMDTRRQAEEGGYMGPKKKARSVPVERLISEDM